MPALRSKTLPVLPLDHGIVLPHMVVTAAIDREDARAALDAASSNEGLVLLLPRVEGRFGRIGTVGKLEDTGTLPSGVDVAVIRALHRGVVRTGVAGSGAVLWVDVESTPDPDEVPESARELGQTYRALTESILEARGEPRVAEMLRGITHPGQLADLSGYSPDLSFEQKVQVLETLDVERRLELVIDWARQILAEIELKGRIRSEVTDRMERSQREYVLRQQLDAIRKELGEDDEDVVEEYRRRVAEAGMPDEVRKQAERELDRLERTPPQNPEHGWIRTYLDWMVDLPWSTRTEDQLDLSQARRVLDADHTGLNDVKDRILEFLAVRKLREERGLQPVEGARGSGAIITLVGPPGVGKTSLGASVARALGRKFVRVSLGGVRDEAEVRGHRRTYVGALPGRIVRALKDAGTTNPVIMLDEIDKLSTGGWSGDPAAALLEVLDPAQNHTFRDHYLDVDLDLSEVLFIPTANIVETIPGPLLDRMEVIRLDGYTEYEKLAIARDHLLTRQLERNGLRPDEVEITEAALRSIIIDHTSEAGVRNLERELGKALRKAATRLAAGELTAPIVIDGQDVRTYLGKAKFHFEAAERTAVPGVATALAVTGTGGDLLFVEATRMAGEDGLTLTGQLGDVMKESAQIALSYVRSHTEELGLPATLDGRVHVHVPAGAVPKDGPSAGVTIVTALTSLLSGRPVRSTVGMTGEVTLQGRVLPIGGVKQKVLAAHRARLKEVILPARNEGDLDEVPEAVRNELIFHLARDVGDVLDVALEPPAGGQDRSEAGALAA
ncbi:MAG: endopeptidase La [Actinomycetota bacterium]|nr:endopeptidase La [Actinomycetota bacterium]